MCELRIDFPFLPLTVLLSHVYAGITHGGVVASIVDDVAFWAVFALTRTPCVTSQLSVRYMRPAPVGVPTVAEARIVSAEDGTLKVEVVMMAEADGGVVRNTLYIYIYIYGREKEREREKREEGERKKATGRRRRRDSRSMQKVVLLREVVFK